MSYGELIERNPATRMTSAFQAADELAPPHHLEAEKSCIGAMLYDNAVIDDVLEILRAEDFYRDAHQVIFRRIEYLHKKGTPVDNVTLGDDLRVLGLWDAVGGMDYLHEIIMSTPHAANARYHANIVKEKAKARLSIEQLKDLLRRAHTQQEIPDDILEAQSRMIESMRSDREEHDELAINPLPTKMEAPAFRGLLGDLVHRIAPETEASPEGILGQLLLTFGNVAGRRPHWVVNGRRHHANLNLCLTGPTGAGRKGTAWDCTRWLFSQCDEQWARTPILSGIASGEGLIQKARDSRGPLLIVESEFGRLLTSSGRDNNTISHVLREAFDGGALSLPTRKDSLYVEDAHISVIGHITYTELRSKITQCDIDNGLVNRFMWLHVYRARSLPEGGDFGSLKQVLAPLIQDLSFAVDFAKHDNGHDVPYMRDDEAKKFWRPVYEELTEPIQGSYGSAVERRAPIVTRIAMIYAMVDRAFYIGKNHIESALAFWRYCDQTAAHIFGAPKRDKRLAKLMELLDAAEDGLRRTDINQKLGNGRMTPAELDALIDAAYASGKYLYKEVKTGGAKRRLLVHKKYSNDEKVL
jgi:hypothetical protein